MAESTSEFYARKIRETQHELEATRNAMHELLEWPGYADIKLGLQQDEMDPAQVERIAAQIEERAEANKESVYRLSVEEQKLEAVLAHYESQYKQFREAEGGPPSPERR
jgi:hypothetical protein